VRFLFEQIKFPVKLMVQIQKYADTGAAAGHCGFSINIALFTTDEAGIRSMGHYGVKMFLLKTFRAACQRRFTII
jgi:hypothetical protein